MRLTGLLCTRISFKEIGELTKKYANYPESYLKRRMTVVEYKTPRGFPQYRPTTICKTKYYFGEHRPWTDEFRRENKIGQQAKKAFVEPLRDWSFFRGDRIEILDGKDKGKQGLVSQVIQERNWVYVEGLNCKLRCVGKTKKSPGVYYQEEKPLLVTSQVALVDPSDLQAVEVEWRYTEEGEKVRVSKRTGRIIPIPIHAEETIDYKTKGTYVESVKDTKEDDLLEVTFNPKLKTFEMDIMDDMRIVEERVPKKTYWY